MPICLSVCPSVRVLVFLSVSVSIYLSVCLSVCLSVSPLFLGIQMLRVNKLFQVPSFEAMKPLLVGGLGKPWKGRACVCV